MTNKPAPPPLTPIETQEAINKVGVLLLKGYNMDELLDMTPRQILALEVKDDKP